MVTDNRIVMAQHPTDMRMGVNGMCGQVRKVGLEPANDDVYIFVCKSRTTMKLLHWERGGYVLYYKRFEQGRFHPRIFLTPVRDKKLLLSAKTLKSTPPSRSGSGGVSIAS